MAKGFDTLHVKSGVKAHNKFDLSRTHLTTMDFGQIVPLFVEETIPGDKFSVKANYFSRLAPLVKPTYGKFDFKTMTAFVPYHQIADDVEAWLGGKTAFEGEVTNSRFIVMSDLVSFTINSDISIGVNSSVTYDFTYVNGSGNRYYYRLTTLGKYYWKILNSLGYVMPEGADYQTGSTWYKEIASQKLSALPFIAFCKAYNDYMSQSQRYNTSELTTILKNIKHNKTYSNYYSSGTRQISALGIKAMLGAIRLCYENDYFTSAWRNANSPLNSVGGSESVYSLDVPATKTFTVSGDPMNEFVLNADNGTVLAANSMSTLGGARLYQRSLDFLKSFDNWVRRNNYSGSRAVQQIYSRFGIKTHDYKSNYAEVIDTMSTPIQVGDVTAQGNGTATIGTSTVSSTVGDYAGKGIMNGDGSFKFECSDYGLLIILGWYSVRPMNAYGYDRMVLRNTALDYYNPEFDGLGAEAISVGEFFSDASSSNSAATPDNAVFGFTERYNSYRFGKDKITGDFRAMSNSNPQNVWHAGRLVGDLRNAGTLVAQSVAVNTMPQTGSEFNRIFSVVSGDVDHFYMTAQFNVSAVRPMLSFNQVPRLGEGDTVVPRNGNVIN